MISLVVTYYVFVYDPVASLRDHDVGEIHSLSDGRHHEANPIDSGFLRFIRSFLGTWYKIKLPKANRDELEKAFNNASVRCCCLTRLDQG